MGKGQWKNDWLVQLAVCLGYSVAFGALNSVSDANWHFNAGLRLMCLLLVPYRYWFALLVGEAIPNAYLSYICLHDLGPTWVAFRMIPPILVAMPVVWFSRTKFNIFPTKNLVDIRTLLLCTLVVSTVWTGYSYTAASLVKAPDNSFHVEPIMAAGYFMGNYLGLLSMVPLALIARLDYRKGRVKELLARLGGSRLILEAGVFVLPMFALLAWLGERVAADSLAQQVIQLAMLLPAAWLTMKYGWRAAALGSTLAIIFNGLLSPSTPDPILILAQAFMGFTVTCLYALGARISAQQLHEDQERKNAASVQRMAKQSLQFSERRLKRTAAKLESIAGSLHITNGQVLDHMRRLVPNIASHNFYKQAVAAHQQVYQLAESLHPVAWRERGLPAALNETIARALDEAGISYRCEIIGRGFADLESSILSAAYRTACESIVYVCDKLSCSKIRLTLRGGKTRRNHWIVVRIEGHFDDEEVAKAVLYSRERRDLAAKLGTNASTLDEMRSHVGVFGGLLRMHVTGSTMRITALMHGEAKVARRQDAPTPLRLWVG